MRRIQLATRALTLGLLFATGTAVAQSMLDYAELWMDPNEFALSSTVSKETLTFDQRRPVRVCLGGVDTTHMPMMAEISPPNDTPLRIDRAVGSTIILEAGTCVDFAAQSIELSPVGTVADNWSLHGTIQSREPRS